MRYKLYRVYVRHLAGKIVPWTETATADPAAAEHAITHMLMLEYFRDKPFVLVATCNGSTYFVHDYSAPPAHHGPAAAPAGRIDWLAQANVH